MHKELTHLSTTSMCLELFPSEVILINSLRKDIEYQLGIEVTFNSVCGMALTEGLKVLERTYQSELPFSD